MLDKAAEGRGSSTFWGKLALNVFLKHTDYQFNVLTSQHFYCVGDSRLLLCFLHSMLEQFFVGLS